MIRNRVKIQGLCKLYFEAARVCDRLALRITIGIRR